MCSSTRVEIGISEKNVRGRQQALVFSPSNCYVIYVQTLECLVFGTRGVNKGA